MKKALTLYLLAFCFYSFFSYSLTDPNLVLTTWAPYWNFQTWMWRTFFDNAQMLSWTFGVLITLLIFGYGLVLRQFQSSIQVKTSFLVVTTGLIIAILGVSYNALSHDVFNYMFNAKMVREYQANPHVQVALDFPQDDWLRFMHNIHTPAPYGYGWTGISLVPSVIGFNKFLPTWLFFRGMSVISIVLLAGAILATTKFTKQTLSPIQSALFFFSPLVLIEIISNSHNDLWMMAPAVLALGLVASNQVKAPSFFIRLLFSVVLLIASVSIKFASLALVPIWVGLVAIHLASFIPKLKKMLDHSSWIEIVRNYWPLAASILLFVPLVTLRSQQFHPWYLTWSFAWIPLFKNSSVEKSVLARILNFLQDSWQLWLIAFSFSSLYRYLPWLIAGNFEGSVLLQQKIITWGVGILFWMALTGFLYRSQNQASKQK